MRAAVKGAKAVNYENAGTLEFLVDANGSFYFMEMNTRIQVEHPVTERVSGLDLVEWQLMIASGAQLKLERKDIEPRGFSIECRVTAEDPALDFRPVAGRVAQFVPPGGPGVRVDSHLYPGYVVPPDYDSLLAKVITWGQTRDQAINRMDRALAEFIITGIPTTTAFLRMLVSDERFRRGEVHTGFVAEFMTRNEALLGTLQDNAPNYV